MIRYSKGPEPSTLSEARARYGARLGAAISRGDVGQIRRLTQKYKHRAVREKLREISHGKCVYCESKVPHQYPGDIEHILPKESFPQLSLEWSNLGYACWGCNHQKGARFDALHPIVNCYEEDPLLFLYTLGPSILPRAGQPRGLTTIGLAGLQRVDLWTRRRDYFVTVWKLFEAWNGAEGSTKNQIATILREMTSPNREYSLMVRTYLEERGFFD